MNVTQPTIRKRVSVKSAGFLTRLARDRRGISLVEFALMLPLFAGSIFAMLELSQYVVATQRMQRISANMGDMVAQSGTASIGASETQINDILSAMQYAAKPFKLKERGRVIVTAVQGQRDPAANNQIKNRKLWHRCDGQLAGKPNKLPGAVDTWIDLPSRRVLLEGEILIYSQLDYEYESLTGPTTTSGKAISIGNLWDPEAKFMVRTASFRPRSKTFVNITPDGSTPKNNCPVT